MWFMNFSLSRPGNKLKYEGSIGKEYTNHIKWILTYNFHMIRNNLAFLQSAFESSIKL